MGQLSGECTNGPRRRREKSTIKRLEKRILETIQFEKRV